MLKCNRVVHNKRELAPILYLCNFSIYIIRCIYTYKFEGVKGYPEAVNRMHRQWPQGKGQICALSDQSTMSTYVMVSSVFSNVLLIPRFVTGVTQRVPHVEQELLTLPELLKILHTTTRMNDNIYSTLNSLSLARPNLNYFLSNSHKQIKRQHINYVWLLVVTSLLFSCETTFNSTNILQYI